MNTSFKDKFSSQLSDFLRRLRDDWKNRLPAPTSTLLRRNFDEKHYLKKNPDVAEAGMNPLRHFLTHGWQEARSPNQWFDFMLYAEKAEGLDISRKNPFLHLIESAQNKGQDPQLFYEATVEASISPRTLKSRKASVFPKIRIGPLDRSAIKRVGAEFDKAYYLEKNPDVAESGVDPLVHFMSIGWIEGRDPSEEFSVNYYLRNNQDICTSGVNPFDHFIKTRGKERWRKSMSVRGAEIVSRFTEGGDLKAYVDEAMALDPMVGFPRDKRVVTSPLVALGPLTKSAERIRSAVTKDYKYVILVPHIRMSGAARVAAIFATQLAKIAPPDEVLFVVTDGSEVQYSHWLPEDVAFLDLFQYIEGLPDPQRSLALIDLLRGLNAEHIININSRLAWNTLSLYGRQLKQEFNVISYLFTWDETPEGLRGGYPIQWLRKTCDFHHRILTDTKSLANDIQLRFGYDQDTAQYLYTPIESSEISAKKPQVADRPRVLWAGRFDRQKRLDLLIEIARQNPDIQFDVYGKSVLANETLSDYNPPGNINEMGTYTDFSEVLQTPYHAFVYTAQWDGLPTILLDVAQAKLPIIAPNVGGIAEIITTETGWLVEDYEDIGAYSKALGYVVSNTDDAEKRSSELVKLLSDKFSAKSYSDKMRKVLNLHET